MSTTIETKFDPGDLPEWAQKNQAVVEFCRIDLAFRCAVHDAQTAQQRNLLRNEARRVMAEDED